MTLEVINAKPSPGTNEFNMAFWWRDFPGTSTPGHYISILRQVLQKENATLDVAALAYALGGIIDVDITISTWQDKYKYLLARPFNYDDVIGQPFTALLGAPHPEYPLLLPVPPFSSVLHFWQRSFFKLAQLGRAFWFPSPLY
jgi:hypothetical protein